jgi:hypothetical protein
MKTITEWMASQPQATRESVLMDILMDVRDGRKPVEKAYDEIRDMLVQAVQTAYDCAALTSKPRTSPQENLDHG